MSLVFIISTTGIQLGIILNCILLVVNENILICFFTKNPFEQVLRNKFFRFEQIARDCKNFTFYFLNLTTELE